MKFRRLALSRKLDQNSKQQRRVLLCTLRKVLELPNTLSKANTGILYQLAKLIEQEDLHVYDLVDEWLATSPQLKSLSPAQRPKLFYAYIKYERLTKEEQLVRTIYLETLKRFSSSTLAIPVREFKALEFSERLTIWFGKPVGNSIADVLVDFLVVVFTTVSNFNKALLQRPKTILGDFGWRTFDTWTIENYGSVSGYALPTKAECTEATLQRTELIALAKVRYKALEQGDIEAFDKLGREIGDR